ncbi:hypothetical protein [Helicobacter cetorum]|uniref:Uncharacterized protein n=1 Tax=Helicobacter cetorum (strain ATCC BAA-429 / MIT 00-7128) TaxID=182217 RepID=I0ELM0_HELC0|nr:hypothetical protein [Helicobacter cetorum]AFI03839.1 hypothetical protein HCW_02790 [Helicobacter cetorum MIT 00-7128]
MKNLIERFSIIFYKGEKVDIEIKIDTIEKLESYTKEKNKNNRNFFILIGICFFMACLTCAYIFKGF